MSAGLEIIKTFSTRKENRRGVSAKKATKGGGRGALY